MKLIWTFYCILRLYPRAIRSLHRNCQTLLAGQLFSGLSQMFHCPSAVLHQAQPSKSGPKRFFYPTQPYKKRISPLKVCLAVFVGLVLFLLLFSPSGPISVLEGIFQLVVWGPFSLCESGWTCNAHGDVTWFGEVKYPYAH